MTSTPLKHITANESIFKRLERGVGLVSRHRLTASTGALVIGGDYRGLGVVRSLGRRGIPVWVLTDEHHLAARSRYARRSLNWPDGDDDLLQEFLVDLCREHGLDGWALVPTGDETAALIARRYEELSCYFTVTTPPWDVFRWAYDKRLTNEIAASAGIQHPHTWHPANRAELESLDIRFPALLKPAFKVTLNHFTIAKAWQVDSKAELLAKYDDACSHATPDAVMVQELIPGDGESQLSYAALTQDGRVVASVTARRTRQYPMDFGRASTFVETITDNEVENVSRRWLEAARFSGLVEVELKRDPRDQQLKLLDVNPRVWGWHTLGRRAGVDFPYLLWRQIFGLEIEEVQSSPGVRWVRGLTDFPTVMKEIRASRMGLRQYLNSLRPPAEWAILALDDPIPGIVEVPYTVRIALRRGGL